MKAMIAIEENKNMQPLHTMACPSVAEFYVEAHNQAELMTCIEWAETHQQLIHILGEGSNTLCAPLVKGLVIRYLANDIQQVSEKKDSIFLRVSAGKNWHELVQFCCENHYWGIENLALIPGCVGAAPIQNIGAYGVEFETVCESVQVFDIKTKAVFEVSCAECEFEYRNSQFKRQPNWLVLSVLIKLHKFPKPLLEYGPLKTLKVVPELTALQVMNEVIKIRQQKLPDPNIIPNSGSFFHNPIINESEHNVLKVRFPDLVSFAHGEHFKVAAGWLIDQAGLKGKALEAGMVVYKEQALVLTNPNQVDLTQLLLSAEQINKLVFSKFGIRLSQEPLILGGGKT